MSNIIDLNSIREKQTQEIEAKASEKFGAIKVGNDSYIILIML